MSDFDAPRPPDPSGPRFTVALPDGWEPVDLNASGTPDLDFAALRVDDLGSPLRPSITAKLFSSDGRPDPQELSERAAADLAARVAELRVLDRRSARPEDAAPSTTQVLQLRIDGEGTAAGATLVQVHTFIVVPLRSATGEDSATVVELTATCAPEQLREVGAEFEQFVGTFRLEGAGTDVEEGGSQ